MFDNLALNFRGKPPVLATCKTTLTDLKKMQYESSKNADSDFEPINSSWVRILPEHDTHY